jgi:hypothetical protein
MSAHRSALSGTAAYRHSPHDTQRNPPGSAEGKDPQDLVWHTPEGIDVKPLYTAADVEGLDFLDQTTCRTESVSTSG